MDVNSNITAHAVDWRAQLRRNNARSRWVLIIFVLFYLAIGLLIDTYFYSALTGAPAGVVFKALVTFQVMPKFTLITLAIAVISLIITYSLHDRLMLLGTEYREITPETAQNVSEKQLYNVVEELKIAAGLHFMPRVFLIDADYMNAFASGYSEKSAMVAITRGLFEKLDRSELQAVMAHELSHIRHGDIKVTLMASVLSNILLIAVDLLFYNMVFGRERRADPRLVAAITILRFLLPLVTLLLMLYLSRTREYMADSGCVELMRDNTPLARALLKIHQDHRVNQDYYNQQYQQTAHEDVRRAAYLYDPVQSGVTRTHSIATLFSTHPSIAQRLQELGIKLSPEQMRDLE